MRKYLIGIDGGGTKTDFVLTDTELCVVSRVLAGRSNPNEIGVDAVCELITESTAGLLESAGVSSDDIAAVFAGISGLTSGGYTQKVRDCLSDLFKNARCDALHDGINVLYGAFPQGDGVCVICGTGSSCFVKKGSDIYRIGGYGAFDRCGNGYEISLAALCHALRAADGRDAKTLLSERICANLGGDMIIALEQLVKKSKKEIAEHCPTVFEASRDGCPTALNIIKENIAYIAEMIEASGRYFEGDYSVALAGGVWRDSLSTELLASMLPKGVNLITDGLSPAVGAAAKAKQLLT